MALVIHDIAPRRQYTAEAGQTVFAVPFEFFPTCCGVSWTV